MKHAHAIADRLAAFALRLVAGVNLLFVLLFVASLAVLGGRARAEEGTCRGSDLVEALVERDPGRLRAIRETAARTANGKGLLWRIEAGEGVAPSFLFGTMHVTDPRVHTLSPAAEAAFEAAATVAIETTDMLDGKAMMAAMAERPDLVMFPPGEALTDHLTAQQREALRSALKQRGVPLQSVVRMRPWMLLSLFAQPACELTRQQVGAPVLDQMLGRRAQAAGKRLVGLESAAEQFAAMASLPIETHVQGILSVAALGEERVGDMTETMIGLYLAGETAMILPVVESLAPRAGGHAAGYAAFEEKLVNARNEVMVERALPLIEEGGAFIAVGALHLPGEAGLVSLLRARGYTVSRAD
ncbi:TraB/GumN family protein [Chelativorans intermedius]|uniref:TraB/GumN family protein n=1 Tax=Chelativorans intermedius TaxID=515947 RepID=A0ABV6DB44_9HYPH|nr:TraB/GumN family protein [Chelativorans intermedius]MCT8997884.1 TraB/GumN family protein [Chelativorans intermedius]